MKKSDLQAEYKRLYGIADEDYTVAELKAKINEFEPVPDPDEAVVHSKKQSKGKIYWCRPVFFPATGETITGVVTEKYLKLFKLASPQSDIEKWTLPYDIFVRRDRAAKKKMKEQAGL